MFTQTPSFTPEQQERVDAFHLTLKDVSQYDAELSEIDQLIHTATTEKQDWQEKLQQAHEEINALFDAGTIPQNEIMQLHDRKEEAIAGIKRLEFFLQFPQKRREEAAFKAATARKKANDQRLLIIRSYIESLLEYELSRLDVTALLYALDLYRKYVFPSKPISYLTQDTLSAVTEMVKSNIKDRLKDIDTDVNHHPALEAIKVPDTDAVLPKLGTPTQIHVQRVMEKKANESIEISTR